MVQSLGLFGIFLLVVVLSQRFLGHLPLRLFSLLRLMAQSDAQVRANVARMTLFIPNLSMS